MSKAIRFLVPLAAGLVLILLAGCATMDGMDSMKKDGDMGEMDSMDEKKDDMDKMSSAASFFFVHPEDGIAN